MRNPESPCSFWTQLELSKYFLTIIIWPFQEQIQKDCLQPPLLFMNKYLDRKFLCVVLCGGISSGRLMLLTTTCPLAPAVLTALDIDTLIVSRPSGHIQLISLSPSSINFSLIIFLFLTQDVFANSDSH